MTSAAERPATITVDGERTIEGSGGRLVAPASAPHFLVHDEGDDVAVAVQDVHPGTARISHLDSGRTISLEVREDIPLGHKVALHAIAEGDDVIEYRVRVGQARTAIDAGGLVHVHNVRSARWEKSR